MAGHGIPFPAPSETQRERALASPNTPIYFARARFVNITAGPIPDHS